MHWNHRWRSAPGCDDGDGVRCYVLAYAHANGSAPKPLDSADSVFGDPQDDGLDLVFKGRAHLPAQALESPQWQERRTASG